MIITLDNIANGMNFKGFAGSYSGLPDEPYDILWVYQSPKGQDAIAVRVDHRIGLSHHAKELSCTNLVVVGTRNHIDGRCVPLVHADIEIVDN